MRIALFTETYLPYINGVVTHVKVLHDGLEQLGHQVLVVCANPNTKRYYIKDGVLNCPGVSSKKFYNYGLASPISPWRYKLIKEFQPDVIHIHNEFGIGFSGAAFAKMLNIPLVYTMHTMYDDYLYYVAPQKLIPIAKKTAHFYAKALGQEATALTGPSKKVTEFFRAVGIDKPVHVIPNPVEIDLFRPDCITPEQREKLRARWKVKPGDLLVCFCGRLGKEKSVDVMLSYWAKEITAKDHLKLMIIGEGPVKEDLERQVQQLGIQTMVMFAGKVMHEKLPPYYAACDLYLTTSLSDTNSISMLEGMATGLPVLHIADELNKGQVVEGKNGFIFHNPDQMRKKLMAYQQLSAQEQQSFRASARESVMDAGAKTLANNLLRVYREAIEINHIQKSR